MGDFLRDPKIHAVLGSIVVTIGFWLVWGELPLALVAAVALGMAAFLAWQGSTIGRVWAWASLLLGIASAAWPIVTMLQIRRLTEQPSDEQMGMILTAVVAGLFAAVFWLSFGWGIFRWVQRREAEQAQSVATVQAADRKRPQKQSKGRR